MNNESFFLDVSFSSWFSFPFSQFNSTSFIFRPRACCTLATSSATHCRATTWAKTDPQTEIEPKSTTVSRQDNRVLHLFTMAFKCYYENQFPTQKVPVCFGEVHSMKQSLIEAEIMHSPGRIILQIHPTPKQNRGPNHIHGLSRSCFIKLSYFK